MTTRSKEPAMTPDELAKVVGELTMHEPVTVTDADRAAAADFVVHMGLLSELTAEHIRRGLYDGDLQVLARYRQAAEADTMAKVVAWLRGCELARAIPDDPAQIVTDLADALTQGAWK